MPRMPRSLRTLGKRWLPALWLLLAAAPAAAQTPVQKIQLLPADALAHLSWTSLATDPKGDGLHPRLPDAKELSYAFDPKTGTVWFKVSVYDPLPERWFGINVAIDDDGNPDNGMTWWGTNKFKFDHLATAYFNRAEGYWQGIAGVADSDGAGHFRLANISREVKVALDRDQRAILLGIPRSAIGTAQTIRVIATVGSNMVNNDDVPNEGAVTVKLPPATSPPAR
jgi:hypothetical protein